MNYLISIGINTWFGARKGKETFSINYKKHGNITPNCFQKLYMKKNIEVSEKDTTLLILFSLLSISNIFHLNSSLPKL